MKLKIAVSIPEELLSQVQRAVHEGEAPSVSAYVTDAIRDRTKKQTLQELLDEWDRELGPPGPEAVAWAEDVRRREKEFWTRGRWSPSSAGTAGSGRSSATTRDMS